MDDDIEITPEMEKAGARLVAAWDYDSPSLKAYTHEQLAREIYSAMHRLAPKKGDM